MSADVEEVAKRNGYTVDRRRIGPCPVCGAVRGGRRDPRPPVGLRAGGLAWWCVAHDGGGGPSAFGPIYADDRPAPVEKVVEYPPMGDVERLWGYCEPEADRSLVGRGIDVRGMAFLDAARGSPSFSPDWWPWQSWVTVPLYDVRGRMRSLHGRRVEYGALSKKGCNPQGFRIESLLMACPAAVEAMSGGERARLGLVCEGITDHLRMVTEVRRFHGDIVAAVWSGGSGSFKALDREWAESWVVMTDPDKQGDAYAAQALRALGGAARYRGAMDVCDTLNAGVGLQDMVKAAEWKVGGRL